MAAGPCRKRPRRARAAGIAADYLDATTLAERFSIARTGAILSNVSAAANPAQLAAGILRAAMTRGVELVSPLEITDLRSTADAAFLATAEGRIVSARHAVFCSGYEFLKAVADENHAIVSTWALATPPGTTLPDWLKTCIVWEGANPYLYLRRTRDGRLIVGGEDEGSAEAYASTKKLRQKAKNHPPQGGKPARPRPAGAPTTSGRPPLAPPAPACR
jgi:glycine/D-amino acid oxidase-like deaminating enzyme